MSSGHVGAVPPGCSFVRADIASAGRVLAAECFDGVLHFAAKSPARTPDAGAAEYWNTNVGGTRALLDATRAHGVPRFVHSSTAAVYGIPASMPIPEATPTRPRHPYSASKLSVDRMLGSYARAYGLGALSLRYFNAAGAYRGRGEARSPATRLITLVLQVAQGQRKHIVIHGTDWPTPDGTCIRDYAHVVDLARAHVLALDAVVPGRHEICNLGNGVGVSVREVIETARQVTGRPISTVNGPRRAGDPAALVASVDHACRLLGWKPDLSQLSRIFADAWDAHGPA